MSKTVLITGASRGIGFVLTNLFIQHNYHVIGTCRAGKIENLTHNNLELLKLDLSDMESIKNVDQVLSKKSIKIDILVNNAGVGFDLDYSLPEEKTFKQTFEINVTGNVFFTESLTRHIKNGGKIINISSKMGSIGLCKLSDSVAYRMSKSALNMYTKILSSRFVNRIKVASVHPGWVRTTIAKSNVNGRLSPEESAARIFDFIISDYNTGIFWDVENQSEIEW